MRVLVVLTPLMYREAIAYSLRQHRPALDLRIAAPEVAEEELRSFAPHLLVHYDTDGLDRAALEKVPSWVEIATPTAWTRGSILKGTSRSTKTSPQISCSGWWTK
jgi:hypothetical protein